jgi:hypothetical protein
LDQSAKFGAEVGLARRTQAMTVRQVAVRAGVAWTTVARTELGDPRLSLDLLVAVGEAVGLDLVVNAYHGRTPSLRDTGQLTMAELLVGMAHGSLKPSIELSVGPHGEAIDVVFFGPIEIVAMEIERLYTDHQAQFRRADRKREMLASQHQRPVRLVMVVQDTERNRTAVDPHLDLIRTSLPAGSREILRALRTGAPVGRDGLLWLRQSQKRSR